MAQISAITNEYLYKLILSYRKATPRSSLFYIILFLFKYFPIILFTHGINPNVRKEDGKQLFTLSRIIKAILIFNNNLTFNYSYLCIVFYCIILIILITFIYIYYRFSSAAKKTDYVLYQIPSNALNLPKWIKILYRYLCVCFMFVIFFYQYFLEIFFYGIFYSYSYGSEDIDHNKPLPVVSWRYVIFILNIIFIIICFGFIYFFFIFSSTQAITFSYGFQLSNTQVNVIVNIFLFSLQGVYSTIHLYNENYQNNFYIVGCFVIVGALAFDLLYTFNQVNFTSTSLIALFLRFMNNFCLSSGIFEIIIYYAINDKSLIDQKVYILKLVLDVVNATMLTMILPKLQNKISLRKLSNAFFLSSKLSCPTENLFQFFLEMKNLKSEQEKYLFILELVQDHQINCNLEICQCHKYKKFLITMKNKEDIDKIVSKFIALGEKKITQAIINSTNAKSGSISKLIFVHCDFLFSIKDNIPVTIYLAQYYLIKKQKELTFKYAYLIYETNRLGIKKRNMMNREEKNIVSFVKENLVYEKIKKLISTLCSNIERLLYYKSVKNTNSKLLFTCENILYPLIEYVKQNKNLIKLIKYYTYRNIFEHSIEIKFIVYYYISLFKIALDKKVRLKIYDGPIEYPSYNDIYTDNYELNNIKNNYIILFLNVENKFIIRYLSTEITESLMSTTNDLVGNDFNEILIPKHLSVYHSIYMKQFILSGNSSYYKDSFLLNKENQLFPVKIECKILPTTNTLYTMIINISDYKFNNYHYYHTILDLSFDIWYISQAFEKEFLFSLKMLNTLNINFCEFFGVNKDDLNEYFKKSRSTVEDLKKNNKIQPFAFITIRNDELYYYKNINKNPATTENLTKLEVVRKDKIVNCLIKLVKNVEQLGLEKEWKLKINELYNKFRTKGTTTEEYNLKKSSHYGTFYLKFHFKQIGNIKYYVATISEYIEETQESQNSAMKNVYVYYKPNAGGAVITGTTQQTATVEKIPPQNTNNILAGFTSGANSFVLNESKGSLISNNSKFTLLAGNEDNISKLKKKTQQEPFQKSHIKFTLNSDYLKEIDIKNKYVALLKMIQTCLFVIVFFLNTISFILGLITMNFTLNLFYVNAYSFYLSNDIFFGSLACINTCLLKNKLQGNNDTGVENMSNLNEKIQTSGDDLMNHYHQLYHHINILINKNQIREIYSILNTKEVYNHILTNWEEKQHSSTLTDELYSIHYSLKTFVMTEMGNEDTTNCRLKEFFFNRAFRDMDVKEESNYATDEEKFIYYIMSNVLTNISQRLEYLNRVINQIINKYNNNAITYLIVFNIAILIFSGGLYGIIIVSIQTSRNIFKGRMVFLFTQHKFEDFFFEDIKRFKRMIEIFCKKECTSYTNFKIGINNPEEYLEDIGGKTVSSQNKEQKSATGSKTSKVVRHKKKKIDKELFYKQQAAKEVDEAALEAKIALTDKQFNVIAEPRYVLSSLVALFFIFFIFLGLEIANILLVMNSYNGLMVENEFATNFLSRGPKINELFLYSIVSVIINEHLYITKDRTKYSESVLSNYYKIDLDLSQIGLFESLGDSNYSYLYYQLYIIRTNILNFVNDANMKEFLVTTNSNEFLFNGDKNFCIYSSNAYYKNIYTTIMTGEFFSLLTELVHTCRTIGNGMNLSGYQAGLDLMLQQLNNLYQGFATSNSPQRQTAFLSENDILMMEQNIINVIQALHFADAFSVMSDIENSYSKNRQLQILFAIIIVIFSCGVILIVLLVIVSRLDFYNEIIENIVKIFEKALKKYH